jgi:hypothetical protein
MQQLRHKFADFFAVVRLAMRASLRKTHRDDFRFLTRRLDAWSYSRRRSSST